jgi:hypothetical protein
VYSGWLLWKMMYSLLTKVQLGHRLDNLRRLVGLVGGHEQLTLVRKRMKPMTTASKMERKALSCKRARTVMAAPRCE